MSELLNFFKSYLPYAAVFIGAFLYPVLTWAYRRSRLWVLAVNIFALLHVWILIFLLNAGWMKFVLFVVCHGLLYSLNRTAGMKAGAGIWRRA